MFENYTYENILDSMLAQVPNTVDKRQGSIIYDALAPAAVELQNMYINLDLILNETFADTASREYLIKRAAERGLSPYAATNAIIQAEFTPTTLEINTGTRFSLDELNYSVIEKISDGMYKLQCEETGASANYKFGQLIPIDYIEGLQYAQVTQILIPGEDEEATDDFRNRYFESLQKQAFGGNITDYKQKVNAICGVGGVKVYPAFNGGGTVKLVIVNSEYQVPSQTLIATVQTTIDPVSNQGQGLGLAPIGHVVTVTGVSAQTLNINSTFTLESSYTWEDVVANINAAINNYFAELNATWADCDNIIVRISQIETRLLDVEGIIDIADTKINGTAANFQADSNSIVTLGTVTDDAATS